MKDNKKLRRLSRAELLELLLIETQEVERLKASLAKAEAELVDRQLRLTAAGDLAHAVLEVNGVMDAAQAAAQQYLENIIAMEQETRETCRRMIEEAEEEARKIREGAQ